MVGPAQLGVLAACVVLFVPMGMAGWHLSRNKMLFFSGALFITLAVGVHLAPFFPSASRFLLSSLPFPPPLSHPHPSTSSSCLPFLHDITFTPSPAAAASWSWSWSLSTPAAACGFQRLGRSDASDLLNGSWVLVAGDSQARLLVLALLRLVLDPTEMAAVEDELFRRHSNYQIIVAEHGIKVDFVWAPYETNLTGGVLRDLALGRHYPDVLVIGSGLWHMLHSTNASDYGSSLAAVRRLASGLLSPEFGLDGMVASQPIHMFWLGLPTLVNSMLNTKEKQEKMNRTMWESYNRDVYESKILRQSGGPLFYLDTGLLSRNCGRRCTGDGMHYDGVVYEATLHILLNALLIESQQRVGGGN